MNVVSFNIFTPLPDWLINSLLPFCIIFPLNSVEFKVFEPLDWLIFPSNIVAFKVFELLTLDCVIFPLNTVSSKEVVPVVCSIDPKLVIDSPPPLPLALNTCDNPPAVVVLLTMFVIFPFESNVNVA